MGFVDSIMKACSNFFVIICSTTMKRLLRRTLVHSAILFGMFHAANAEEQRRCAAAPLRPETSGAARNKKLHSEQSAQVSDTSKAS